MTVGSNLKDESGIAEGAPPALPRSATLSSPSDQLNRSIVRLLQEDGRLPFKTIAEQLGVSEGTVRNRVGWMKRSGMLRIVAVADPTAMNYRADAMVGLKVAPGSTPAKVGQRLAVHPEVRARVCLRPAAMPCRRSIPASACIH